MKNYLSKKQENIHKSNKAFIWSFCGPRNKSIIKQQARWSKKKKKNKNKNTILSLNEEHQKLGPLKNNERRKPLIDSNGEVKRKAWKMFKDKHLITGRHIDELLRSAREPFLIEERIKNFKDKPIVSEDCKSNIGYDFCLVDF